VDVVKKMFEVEVNKEKEDARRKIYTENVFRFKDKNNSRA
jgi:hypothetical protein